VFITDRGEPAHVLMTTEEYRRLTGGAKPSIAEALALDGVDDFDEVLEEVLAITRSEMPCPADFD
jgi:hypothetical protein